MGVQAAKLSVKDLILPVVVAASGGAGLTFAMLQRWNPQDMNPGVEGCLATGILGGLLAVSQGLPFQHVLALYIPLLGIQFSVLRSVNAPAFGVLGIELIALGLFGVVSALLAPALASPPEPS